MAAVLFCVGIFTKIPQKEISFFNIDGNGYEEYVGGDAYNIQIEASLRSGEIAGAKTAKAVYISCAAISFIFSLSLIAYSKQEATLLPVANTQNDNTAQEKDSSEFPDHSESEMGM